MTHEEQYRATSAEQQQRLAELSAGDPSDLSREIGLTRLLVENSISNPGLCANLLTVAGRLVAAHQLAQERSGEVLARAIVLAMAQSLVTIVADELIGIEGGEDHLAAIADRFAVALEPKLLLEVQ